MRARIQPQLGTRLQCRLGVRCRCQLCIRHHNARQPQQTLYKPKPLAAVKHLVQLAVRLQWSHENFCVSPIAGRPGTSAFRSNTAAEHLHREAALLADVAKQPPAAGAPRKQRQPAAAGHREIAAVGAERRVPERPVGCQVCSRRAQVVHLRRSNPVMQRTKASASDARNMQSSRPVSQRCMLLAACCHLTSRSLRLEPELPSPKALPTPLPSGCSLISSTLSAACMQGAHGFRVGNTPPYCGKAHGSQILNRGHTMLRMLTSSRCASLTPPC